MADPGKEWEELDFENVVTLLNSGNVIFETITTNPGSLEKKISGSLEKTFGFP